MTRAAWNRDDDPGRDAHKVPGWLVGALMTCAVAMGALAGILACHRD